MAANPADNSTINVGNAGLLKGIAGTLSLDGVMLDKPHLTQAIETLRMAG